MTRQARAVGVCCYCRNRAEVSADHVPPKTVFAKPRPSTLITVPACGECHSDACSKDDEYFRLVVSFSHETGSNAGAKAAREAGIRSLKRPEAEGLRRGFLSQVDKKSVTSPAGLYLGRR